MEGADDPHRALYPRLLGPHWGELSAAVRGMHLEGEHLRAAGTFRIRRGKGRLRRLAARFVHAPAEGDGVPTRLEVTRVGSGERWRRTFATSDLVTWQRPSPSGGLEERYGPWVLRFHLLVEGGALVYAQRGAALGWGRLAVPLPRWLAPRVLAREEAAGPGEQTRVSLRVSAPLLGTVLAYDGTMRREEHG